MNAKAAWNLYNEKRETIYAGVNFPDYSSVLGSDYGFGWPVNQTKQDYDNRVFEAMRAKYGDEEF
jgi:hypothetical protein